MVENTSSPSGLTVKQANEFLTYLKDTYAEISGRNPSSAYRKANQHEADRVRELIGEFRRIGGVADDAAREWTSTEVAALLAYIASRKTSLEQSQARLQEGDWSDWKAEDMEQDREQWRMFERARVRLEQIIAGDAAVSG